MLVSLDQKYKELCALVEQMAGKRLPGERELADRLDVSRPHIRSMLSVLETQGLVERRQGSGTYAINAQSGRPRQVALLVDEDLKLGDDPFFSLLIEHIVSILQIEGIDCVIERINNQHRSASLKDGAITLGMAGTSVLNGLRPEDPPVVGVFLDFVPPPHIRASVFQLADKEAGQKAALRLVEEQCSTFIFVGRQDIIASQRRLSGVEEVAIQHGIPFHFVNCALNYNAGVRLGRELELPVEVGPVGIIVSNDWLAVGLHSGLTSRRYADLQTVHIISFDGLPLTADPTSGVVSLAVPIESIANDAVAELRRLLRSKVSAGRVIQYQLNWREVQQ